MSSKIHRGIAWQDSAIFRQGDWQGLWQREVRVNHILLREPWADVVANKDATMHLEAAGLNIRGAGNFKNQSGDLEVSLHEVLFSRGNMHPLPADIVLKARLAGGKLSVSTFKFTSGPHFPQVFWSRQKISTPLRMP